VRGDKNEGMYSDEVSRLKSAKSPTERKILFKDVSRDESGPGVAMADDGVVDEVMPTGTGSVKFGGRLMDRRL
jgi:hypothetical protein